MEYQFLILILTAIMLGSVEGYHQRPRQQDMQILINTGESRKMLAVSKSLLQNILHHVSISPSNTRIGIISYGKEATVNCQLNETINRESILQTIQNIKFSKSKGKNKLYHALLKAEKSFKEQKRYKIFISRTGHYKISYSLVPQYFIIIDHIRYLWKMISRRKIVIGASERPYYLFSFESHKDTFFARRPNLYFSPQHYRIRTKLDVHRAMRKITWTPAFNGLFGVCRPGRKYQYDECNRRCICSRGKLVDCYRIRKEFTQLSIRERIRYINAYLAITTFPNFSVRFNNFTRIHKDFFCSGIHNQQHFLPWHRWYVLAMENMLRTFDCRLTAVYWDWSYWHGVAWQPGIHIWGSEPYQLGSDGSREHNYCVKDGPFASNLWTTPYWDQPLVVYQYTNEYLTYANQSIPRIIKSTNFTQCLRRRFNTRTPTIAEVQHALNQPASNFDEFERLVREDFHNGVHNAIGGHMCTDYASVSPEFFMHHAILDKIWYLWQKKSIDRKYVYFKNHTRSMADLTCPYSPSSLLDSSRLPNLVKVIYSRFPSNERGHQRKKDWIWQRGSYQHYRKTRMHTKLIFCEDDQNSNSTNGTKMTDGMAVGLGVS